MNKFFIWQSNQFFEGTSHHLSNLNEKDDFSFWTDLNKQNLKKGLPVTVLTQTCMDEGPKQIRYFAPYAVGSWIVYEAWE